MTTVTARPGEWGSVGQGHLIPVGVGWIRDTQLGRVHDSPPLEPPQQGPEGSYLSPNIMGSLRHWVQASWNHCRQR